MAIDEPLRMGIDELNDFLQASFEGGRPYSVTSIEPGRVRLEIPAAELLLRPGGTVSGPTLMMLADAAAWAAILVHIGPVALAVTSNLNISFLRKPQPVGVIAEAELLKLGRKLAVVDVRLRSEGSDDLVAQSTVTYAIPSSDWDRSAY
jgi:uncharacterized protein (TIGR00369 family)